MALRWTNEARGRIAPRTLADLDLRRSNYASSWRWLRSSFTKLGWNELEAPPDEVKDDRLAEALDAASPDYCAELFGQKYGVARVFKILLPKKEKGLTPAIARTLILRAGDDLAECTELAAAAWETGDVVTHRILAYAFFENDAWREQALAEILKLEGFSNEALALVRTEDEARSLLARKEENGNKVHIEYCELSAGLEEAALPLLMEMASKVRGNMPHLSHALALSVFDDRSVAEHFAAHLSHPTTRGVIGSYFERHKALAEEVLPAASEGASRNAALVKALMIKVIGAPAEEIELAPAHDPAIPEVLRDPPWKKRVPDPPKMKIDLAAYPERVDLAPEAIAQAIKWLDQVRRNAPEMNEEEAAVFSANLEKQTYWSQWTPDGKAVPLELVLRAYNRGVWARPYGMDDAMLAKFGNRALPGFVRNPNGWLLLSNSILRGIDSPTLALAHANLVMQRVTPYSKNPWIWLGAQPRAATFGLLAAIDEPSTRANAEIVLRRVGERHRDAVLAVAKEIHQLEWVTELLDRDPRFDFVAPPKVELHPATRPKLADGRGLPDAIVTHLYEMIAMSSIELPYAGFEDVRAACDRKSLSDMSWDLAALAEGGGRASQARRYADWMRCAVVHFGDDEVIRRLTPALKHATIYRALEALAAKGSRIAMMEIATAHEREDPAGKMSMSHIAGRAGVGVDEMIESILPTIPLAASGRTELQYGKRKLEVGFDTTLAPFLFFDEARLASLPRAKKGEDPVAIRLAKERWDELKEDVRTIASLRCRELNTAVRTRRAIPAPRFLSGWAHHPLGKHLARGMVWAVERNGALVTFRVAEDSSLADVDDNALELADSEAVIAPHPLDLDRTILDRWSTIFIDYGLIQPIHQLERTPLPFEDAWKDLEVLDRPIAPPIPVGSFDRVLTEQGFERHQRSNHASGETVIWGSQTRVDRKRKMASVRLEIRDANARVKLGTVHPRDLAEAMFTLRLLLEAT